MNTYISELIRKRLSVRRAHLVSGKGDRRTWTKLGFSKYSGKTLPQVLFLDPDWFFWAIDDGAFYQRGALQHESEVINHRARNIKIRNNDDGAYAVEYFLHTNRTFSDFHIVSASKLGHPGGNHAVRLQSIDMSLPYQLKKYDKRGNKNFVQTMKSHLFDDKSWTMTKNRCENFFSNPIHFAEH